MTNVEFAIIISRSNICSEGEIMNLSMLLRTVFEIAMFAAVLWGIFHEDRLVAFERKIACLVRRRRLKVIKSSRPESLCNSAEG